MENQAQHPGQGVGGQVGTDGHGEESKARTKDPGLWWQDGLIGFFTGNGRPLVIFWELGASTI